MLGCIGACWGVLGRVGLCSGCGGCVGDVWVSFLLPINHMAIT